MKIYLSTILLLLFSFSGFSQDVSTILDARLPDSFAFEKKGDDISPIYQALPTDGELLSKADLGQAFQALGIIAQPEKDTFGLLFVNAANDFQFEAQKDKPFILNLGTEKVIGLNIKVVKKQNLKKLKLEVITINISRTDFEKLLTAASVLISYGSINYNVSSDNLRAFRFVRSRIISDIALKRKSTVTDLPPVNTGGDISVQGYYRKDGTYVRPHTRKRGKP